MSLPHLLLGAALLTLASTPSANANPVNVNEALRSAINSDATARSAVLKLMGLNEPQWQIAAIRVPALQPLTVTLDLPQAKPSVIAASLVAHCGAGTASLSLTLSEELTNRITLRKQVVLDAGLELNVPAAQLGFGGGTAGNSTFSLSRTDEQVSTDKAVVSESLNIAFSDKGGRLSVLSAARTEGNRIPWSVSMAPADADTIQIKAAPPTSGEVCFHDGSQYTGKKRCFPVGEHANMGKDWFESVASINVPEGYAVDVFQHADFKGGVRNLDRSELSTNSGAFGMLKGQINSAKVIGPGKMASLRYADLKPHLPRAVQSFVAKGDLDIIMTAANRTELKHYALTPAQIEVECSRPDRGSGAGPSGQDIRQRKLNSAEAQQVRAAASPLSP